MQEVKITPYDVNDTEPTVEEALEMLKDLEEEAPLYCK